MCLFFFSGPTHGKVVVCYIATWAVYRPGEGKFELGNLEPSLCTHLVYSFAGLDESTNSIKSLGTYIYMVFFTASRWFLVIMYWKVSKGGLELRYTVPSFSK